MPGVADTLVCAYPNAGLPNEFGGYDETPEYMAAMIGEFAGAGLVNIVGGCCGTKPGPYPAFGDAVAGHGAAPPARKSRKILRLSGLEPFTPDAGHSVHQCRRAHQHHRLGASSAS